MEVVILPDPAACARYAARVVASVLAERPGAALGVAAGSTMEPLYAELARLQREGALDLSRAELFLLDEWAGVDGSHPASFERFVRERLLAPAGLARERLRAPRGEGAEIPAACASYERAIREAGGIDLQLLGLGVDGHLGFNEPGSSLASRTRLKTLTAETAARSTPLFGREEDVPRHVLTMGLGTILESRAALLLAFGEAKAAAAAAAVEGPLTASVPASALQLHPRALAVLDEAAGSRLLRGVYYRSVLERKPAWQRPPELSSARTRTDNPPVRPGGVRR
ncbi:MAG TPA: glucosamine-6-phosphate deaminase [Thermoanaerobaculia bacterium]|nr:glucosamine-6-phosphate deaminase [Thermoanaerobaculia bacterium]